MGVNAEIPVSPRYPFDRRGLGPVNRPISQSYRGQALESRMNQY